jgi:hypothetical protein
MALLLDAKQRVENVCKQQTVFMKRRRVFASVIQTVVFRYNASVCRVCSGRHARRIIDFMHISLHVYVRILHPRARRRTLPVSTIFRAGLRL